MFLDSVQGQHTLFRDLLIALARGKELQDVELAACQRDQPLGSGGGGGFRFRGFAAENLQDAFHIRARSADLIVILFQQMQQRFAFIGKDADISALCTECKRMR